MTAWEDDTAAMAAMRAPALRAGDLLIFDYRALHRGLANSGPRARPVGYVVISTGLATDRQNFDEFPELWT